MARSACAACRSQRKKCSDECLLAPHFPPNELQRYLIVQRVYGRVQQYCQNAQSNDIRPDERGDAVNSLVYEATARMEDPVNGCAKAIQQMQKKIVDLESQLAAKQEEIMNMHFACEKLMSSLVHGSFDAGPDLYDTSQDIDYGMLTEEVDPMLREQLWAI